MADNRNVAGVTAATGGAGDVAADEIGTIVYQQVKLVDGTLNSTTPIPGGANGLQVQSQASTSAPANVASSATSVSLVAANSLRRMVVLFNDPVATAGSLCYVVLNASVASTTNFTYRMSPGATLEIPYYTGEIRGIWAAASTGSMRVTEFTA